MEKQEKGGFQGFDTLVANRVILLVGGVAINARLSIPTLSWIMCRVYIAATSAHRKDRQVGRTGRHTCSLTPRLAVWSCQPRVGYLGERSGM